ncbi:MAG: hypothetical protein HC819_06945 [Cyclobacteriaceae bacterium]|nr:hypothetical protein [Cyclobacteriaceae bacterium]
MKKIFNYCFLMAFLAFSMFFSACKDDAEDVEPTDIIIKIDDKQTFSQNNFIKSFEQVVGYFELSVFEGYTHEYDNGKLIKSYNNYTAHGKFGEKYIATTHFYNSNGVITSSSVMYTDEPDDTDWMSYEYDQDGFIIKVNYEEIDDMSSYETFAYNDKGLLVTRKWLEEGEDDSNDVTTYEYDSQDRLLKVYDNEKLQEKLVYLSDTEIRFEYYNEDSEYDWISTYTLNADKLLIKEVYTEGDWVDFEYFDDYYSMSYYYADERIRKVYHSTGVDKLDETWFYSYDEDDKFDYCIYRDKTNSEEITEGYKYYEGTVDELILIGYSTIVEDELNGIETTIFDKVGKKLYTYKYDDNSQSYEYYDAQGKIVKYSDVLEWAIFISR